MEQKRCKKCVEIKPTTEFYHHKGICKSCTLDQNKRYRQKNKDQISKKSKIWYQRTKVDRREHKAAYYRERRKYDDLFKLKSSVVRLIRTSINRNGFKKTSKTSEILGCSYEEFKLHLEKQFEPWMNWGNKGLYNGTENYGWDIDHIIPLKTAKTEEDIIRLNHYKNLRPLCSKLNRDIKKDKY